ncbi:hypothetical protein HMPREF3202_01063 [Prevotella bivia]|jgi:hypothetical protein|uniref:Uncharacterized protein n=1 Tax=Prevotella bivia TaxID=28125 RepID=A0A137SY68_9BACT|nr:hypothetical protein HMPREF3202_01063 [Prevotella bivia]
MPYNPIFKIRNAPEEEPSKFSIMEYIFPKRRVSIQILLLLLLCLE